MDPIINGLLGSSKISRSSIQKITASLCKIVKDITDEIPTRESWLEVEITITPQVFVNGDKRHI
jgi:hypothetical protein